jgi:hypothetical protein
MNGIASLGGALAAALSRTLGTAATRIAAEVPADVRVGVEGEGVRLTGRALGLRALTDARLRDFAVLARRRP